MYASDDTTIDGNRHANVRPRNSTPAPAANTTVANQRRCATQSGAPMVSKNQYQGPIGNR